MKVFETDKIRNVVLLGHGACGKTTLAEAMAYVTNLTTRMGRVEDGSTISDYDKEEAKRGFSISTTMMPIEWEDTKINVLDTPGYFDFVGEVEEALTAADGAVIVVSAKAGVQVGTEKAWEYCEKFDVPRIIFVTDMDNENADYTEIVQSLKDLYGKKIAPFHLPIKEKESFEGFVNVVKMGGRKYNKDGTYVECDIPNELTGDLEPLREMILEAVAETNEDLMDKYFNGEEFTQEEISGALRKEVIEGAIVPVQAGSAINTYGVRVLMDAIVKYLPSPHKEHITVGGVNVNTKEAFEADYDNNKPFSAYVFKTIVDPFIGRYSMIKVNSGILKPNSTLFNARKDVEEKVNKLYVLKGKDAMEVAELHAGDIGAIAKLSHTSTGDTLSTKNLPIEYDITELSIPYTYVRYNTKSKGDDDKVSSALAKIMEEDLTIHVVNDKENHQTLIYGIGEQHLDVTISRILNKYKVEIEVSKPKVPYRETIRKKAMAHGKHKKQSGGHGQFGDVHIEFEPSGDLNTPYIFEEKIFGGAVPRNYFPAVEKGLAEGVLKGPLAGYPVVGVKATLTDGSYHPVDSSEMAFKLATSLAFKKGIMEASPVLLEPIVTMKVVIPDKYTGDVMGDLNKRRGRVLGMNPIKGGKQEVVAEMPMAELYGYSTELRSMTGGRGDYSYEFERYDQAPSDVQNKIVYEHSLESNKED